MKSPATLSCFVALLGCGAPPLKPLTLPAARPASRPAASKTFAPQVGEPGPEPLADSGEPRRELSPEEREIEEMLGDVCQVAYGEHGVGCACCAPFDECKPHASRKPPDPYASRAWQVLSGSFTRAGADQRALPLRGCALNIHAYGGMLVLEHTPRGFVISRYVDGLSAQRCWAVRRDDARDLLLCVRGDMHQGHAETLFFQWDLALDDEALLDAEPLLSVEDAEPAACVGELGDSVSSKVVRALDLSSRRGRPELELEIDAREGKITSAYQARCREIELLDEPPPRERSPRALLRGHVERLVFRFDGKVFVASSP